MAYYATLASNITTGDLTSALSIATGSVHVYGIVVANTAAAAVDVTVQNNAGTTIMVLTVPADSTVVMNVPFLAAGGIKFAAGAVDTKVTVLHSNTSGAA